MRFKVYPKDSDRQMLRDSSHHHRNAGGNSVQFYFRLLVLLCGLPAFSSMRPQNSAVVASRLEGAGSCRCCSIPGTLFDMPTFKKTVKVKHSLAKQVSPTEGPLGVGDPLAGVDPETVENPATPKLPFFEVDVNLGST